MFKTILRLAGKKTDKSFPPLRTEDDNEIYYLILYRRHGDPFITMYSDDFGGESYDLTTDTIRRYLMRLGCEEDLAEHVIGYVWNFKTVLFDTHVKRCYWVPKDDILKYIRGIEKWKPETFQKEVKADG